MEPNKIVMHFKEGLILKGSTSDFFPNKESFHAQTLDGKIRKIEVESLKALFFVKDVHGDKHHRYKYNDLIAGAGKKIQVNFNDGETMTGYVLGYSPQRAGFFLTPADLKGNNERVYIVKSATKNIDILTREEKRKFHRAETANLVSYECIQVEGGSFVHGIGTTLDISQGGILVESQTPIESEYIILSTADRNDNLMSIKGKVVYCRQAGPDIYHSGIHFVETTEKIREMVVEMVKAFLKTKTDQETKDSF